MSREGPGEVEPPPTVEQRGRLYPPENWRFEDQADPPWDEEVADFELFESDPIEDRPTLTEEDEQRVLEVVLDHDEVRELLVDDRHEVVGAGLESTRREKAAEPSAGYLAVVYDYDEDHAVEAHLNGDFEVVDVETARHQPPPTPAERERAVEMAREDSRLAGQLGPDLVGRTLLAPDRESGRRRIEVRFADPDRRLPEYHATVDLSEETVTSAGQIEQPESHRGDGSETSGDGDEGSGGLGLLQWLLGLLRRLLGSPGSTGGSTRGDSNG